MMLRIRALLLGALFSLTSGAHAVGNTAPFVITQLYISFAENYHVRVSGFPAISACPSGPTWAYINQSQAGSKEYIAALMIAYASGKPVSVIWQPDANGYCQIFELIV
jgi:hypothetical protein